MPFPVPRMRDLLTRGQHGEVGQAHVYADALTGSRARFRVERVDVECHEPPTGRVTGHGHRRRVNVGRVHVRQDQTTLSGALILARYSAPSFILKAARV